MPKRVAAPDELAQSRFDRDTAVKPSDRPRKYNAEIRDGWSALGGMPNGGYVLGLCIQALRQEMPHADPLVVSAFFIRPASPGAASIRAEFSHKGRRHATGDAVLAQNDKEVVRATATFTDLTRISGRSEVLNDRPPLPPPEECVDGLGGEAIPGVSITERIEYRMPEVPGWLQGDVSGNPHAEFWMRFKDDRPVDVFSLVSLVDAAAPAVVELSEGSSTVELTVHVRARPVPEPWVACRVTTRHVINGYHEEDFEIWDASGQLVAQSRQLALLPSARWTEDQSTEGAEG